MTDATETLRAAGLRVTRPRRTLLDWLAATPGHHSADDVVAGTGLPRATTYHVLGQLRDAGLVVATEAAADQALFEALPEHPHHHFVCRSCRGVVDVPDDLDLPEHLDGIARVDEVEVVLRGTCDACA